MNRRSVILKAAIFLAIVWILVWGVRTLAGSRKITAERVQSRIEAACLNQLRGLGVAPESYLQDHNRILPNLAMGRSSKSDDSPVLETVLQPYVESADAFKCPQNSREFDKSGSSYFWNHLQSDLPVSQLAFFGINDRPSKIPLIFDKESWHPNGTNFFYADQTSSNKVRFATGN